MNTLFHTISHRLDQRQLSDNLKGRGKLLGAEYVSLGISLVEVRRIVARIYSENKQTYQADDIISVADTLLSSDVYEKKMAGIFLLGKYVSDEHVVRYQLLEDLIAKHVIEWSLCDAFATDVVTLSLKQDWEQGKETLAQWSTSNNQWVRRAALVGAIKCKDVAEDWQAFAEKLITVFATEREPQVIKARKWLMREAQ